MNRTGSLIVSVSISLMLTAFLGWPSAGRAQRRIQPVPDLKIMGGGYLRRLGRVDCVPEQSGPGAEVEVKVILKNTGKRVAAATKAHIIFIDKNRRRTELKTLEILPFRPGRQRRMKVFVTIPPGVAAGKGKMRVEVDPVEGEVNERNNAGEGRFIVSPESSHGGTEDAEFLPLALWPCG